ncbi:MAG: hypothetical protein KGK03_04245 [Candidatus Omnitrophica bacterium]|nr:hypothetical protein [Candidatus Omnitrophota bacterium]MDE2222264.1 hypothetical protein [Candidatus Omnitrophota bacterium]
MRLQGPTPRIRGKKCCICGRPVYSNHSNYCRVCHELARRMAAKRLPASTIKDIWDYLRQHGYVCYYTGMKLDTDNRKSPWYIALDHWNPGDSSKVVVTSALFNEMKSDMTEDEVWYYIEQFRNFKVKGTRVRKRRLVYWARLAGPS